MNVFKNKNRWQNKKNVKKRKKRALNKKRKKRFLHLWITFNSLQEMHILLKRQTTIFNMAAAAMLNCRKLVLVAYIIMSACDSVSTIQISRKSAKLARDIPITDFQYGVQLPS